MSRIVMLDIISTSDGDRSLFPQAEHSIHHAGFCESFKLPSRKPLRPSSVPLAAYSSRNKRDRSGAYGFSRHVNTLPALFWRDSATDHLSFVVFFWLCKIIPYKLHRKGTRCMSYICNKRRFEKASPCPVHINESYLTQNRVFPLGKGK
jgi:hypothetical protein